MYSCEYKSKETSISISKSICVKCKVYSIRKEQVYKHNMKKVKSLSESRVKSNRKSKKESKSISLSTSLSKSESVSMHIKYKS